MNTRSQISKDMYLAGMELMRKEFETVLKEYSLMDLFAFNMGGDTCEIEIKVNDYDFYKEFTKYCKKYKHLAYKYHAKRPHGFCPTRYYFMVPYNLRLKAIIRIKKELPHYGLIVFHDGKPIIVRKAKRMHKKPYTGETLKRPFDKYIKHYKDEEKLRLEVKPKYLDIYND